jgi:hypothetical protein
MLPIARFGGALQSFVSQAGTAMSLLYKVCRLALRIVSVPHYTR